MQREGLRLVKVRYITEATGEIADREYTYWSEVALEVGDQVIVPVRGHSMTSIVTAVDVPESEIAAFRDAVKTIPAGANVELPPGGLAAAAQAAGAEIHVVTAKVEMFPEPQPPQVIPSSDTAAIRIRPQDDPAVVALSQQAEGLKKAALARNLTVNEDLKPAMDDLILIGKVLKAVKAAMNDYVNPIKGYLKDVQAIFQTITGPLDEADAITRQKVLAYNAAAEKRQHEADEINRQAEELARKQAELNQGAFTVNTEPIVVPPPVHMVHTESGTVGGTDHWKAKVVDFALLPDSYKLPNEQVLNAYARSTKGKGAIPGVEFFNDKGLSVRASGRV